MNTRMLIAVVVSMFVCQQVHAQDAEPEAEATELEGTWEVVSCVVGGEQRETNGALWRFEGNRIHSSNLLIYIFSVDPSAMPAEIDLIETGSTEFILGIYEIDGDSLTLCYGRPRPDRFESTEDYPTGLYVFRRVEEESE